MSVGGREQQGRLSGQSLSEGEAGGLVDGLEARELLPAADDRVDIPGVDLDAVTDTAHVLGGDERGAGAEEAVEDDVSAGCAIEDRVGAEAGRLHGRMEGKLFAALGVDRVSAFVGPDIATVAAMAPELDIVGVRGVAELEYHHELRLAAVEAPHAGVGLDPGHDIDEREVAFTTCLEQDLDMTPVDEDVEEGAVDAELYAKHEIALQEREELFLGHLARRHGELSMLDAPAAGEALDREVVGHVAQDTGDENTLEQPENCRRVEAIAAEDPVEAELPEIAQLGNRRLVALRRRRVIKSSIVRLGQRRLDQHIDLGDLEADVFITDIEVDQGLKLAGEFVIVPFAEFADPVVEYPEGTQFSLIEMRYTNTGQDLQTEFFGHQIARIARDNAVIGINDERDNEADFAEALFEQAKLLLCIPSCLPVGRQEVAQRDKVNLLRHPRHGEAIIAQPRAFIGTVVPIVLLNLPRVSVFFSLIHNNTATLAVDWSPLGTKRQRLKPLPSRSITATKPLTALSTLRGGEDTSK